MNQEESEHNEVDGMKKGVDSKGEVMHMHHGYGASASRGMPVYSPASAGTH